MSKKKAYKPVDGREANRQSRIIMLENSIDEVRTRLMSHKIFAEPKAVESIKAMYCYMGGGDMTIYPELPEYELARFEAIFGRLRRMNLSLERLMDSKAA